VPSLPPLLLVSLLAVFPAFGNAGPVAEQLSPLPAGSAKITGHIGQQLDSLITARYTSDFARQEIYPETEAALQRRVDDKLGNRSGYWQGEFWGKWMLGAIAAQRYTGDPALKEFIRKAVREVLSTQDARGYIGTYSKTDMTKGGWNIWGMKYTLWALLEAHDLLGDPEFLAAAQRQMDYLMTFVGPGKTEIADTGNFNGLPSSSILQPLVKLYRDTGEQRYLDFAKYIADQLPGVMTKGLNGEPIHGWFPQPEKWAKAYEFTHCVEGLVDLYRVTKNADYLQAAQNIAADIIQNERTIVGNVSQDDKFDHAPLRPDAYSEVCDAVYWERLCAALLRLTGDVTYANELERTLYNSLYGSMNSAGTWGVRRLALKAPHLVSAKHCWMEHQQCCVANAPRGFLQAAECAVMTSPEGPVVNLYLPGIFKSPLPSGGELIVQTDYPESGTVNIRVNPARTQEFSVALRIPDWSKRTTIKVNGTPLTGIEPNSYFKINRTWASGDRIELQFDMRGRVTRFLDANQKFMAIECGPVVLARDSAIANSTMDSTVALATDEEGCISLKARPAPAGFWMVFDAPLVNGGTVTLCDYSSVGEAYKQQIADYYSPPKSVKENIVPQPGVLPAGMENFQVWLPVKATDNLPTPHVRTPPDPARK